MEAEELEESTSEIKEMIIECDETGSGEELDRILHVSGEELDRIIQVGSGGESESDDSSESDRESGNQFSFTRDGKCNEHLPKPLKSSRLVDSEHCVFLCRIDCCGKVRRDSSTHQGYSG